ncbi:hypothetical protein IMSAGC020_01872 [Lachnospiraceae bacterium]|nr:hypothetical protein IMSAGC020_01872 [Lachnospiraceae bacterium]
MAADGRKGFLNVYNFIPFQEKKSEKYKDEDRHTGVIRYNITTKTPLFIPNTSNADAYDKEEHKSYDFFSYTELEGKTKYKQVYEPVIPGSELRGMVRNLYEILTGSCMSVLNSEERPVKRTAEIFKPALIEKRGDGQFVLISAKECIFREYDNKERDTYAKTKFHEGEQVYFKEIPRFGKSKSGNTFSVTSLVTECSRQKGRKFPDEGYLIKGMKSPDGKNRKHNARIFMVMDKEKLSAKKRKDMIERILEEKDLERLSLVLTSYQKQAKEEESYQEQPQTEEGSYQEQPKAKKDSYQEYKEAYDKFRRGDGEQYFPVYYSLINEKKEKSNEYLYLAPAKITKEVSNVTIGKLAGEFKPCEKVQHACPACDLFGMVGESNEESCGSRIRFSDAHVEKKMNLESYYLKDIALQELASPKLGNTEFYLKRPDGADFWTYDYYVKGGEVILAPGKIRGRKFYWNQPDVRMPNSVKENLRNKTVRPVRDKIVFEGELYYDGISEKQMRQLIWILNGGSRIEGEDDIVYKLGAGKPLGLGSVELKVTEVKERILEEKNGYLSYSNKVQEKYKNIGTYLENGFSEECRKEFFNMTSFERLKGIHITYPVTEEQKEFSEEGLTEGYKWFVQNHRYYKYITGQQKVNCNSILGPDKMPQKRVQHKTMKELPKADEICTMPYKLL